MTTVEIRVEGDPRQMDAAEALAALSALAKLVATWSEDSPRWRPVDLKLASLAMVLAPASDDPATVERATREATQIRTGLVSFLERAVLPPDFDARKARLLRKAGSHMNASAGVTGISMTMGGAQPISITPVMLDNIGEAVRDRRVSFGSALGRLDIVNLRGRVPKMRLLDERTGDDVACILPPDQVEHATTLIGRHVEVIGMLTRDTDGRKTSIEVTSIEERDRPLRPPIDNLVGVLGPEWTGGLDSVEWVRRQRD